MAVELVHEALAEAHDLHVAFALGIKIAAALGTADGQTRQRIFQRLFKGQKFHGVERHRGMQAQAALVRADGAAALHAVAAIYLNPARVVDPRHAEGDHALRLHKHVQHTVFYVFRMRVHHGLDGFQHAAHGDQKLLVACVARLHGVHQLDEIFIPKAHMCQPPNLFYAPSIARHARACKLAKCKK